MNRDAPPPLSEEDLIRINQSFYFFCTRVMPYSFEDGFIDGAFIEEICSFMERFRKTARVSAKDHFKSTALKCYFMWRLMIDSFRSVESHYFSYEEGMAAYHTGKIKQWVKANPYFRNCRDLKPAADSVLAYSWDGVHTHTLTPHGLLSFKRGIHTGPYGIVFIDDPLKDPENQLVLTKIKTINNIFESQIMDMPDPTTGEVHVVGTPQTKEDFFFNAKVMRRFAVAILPAIQNEAERRALWPEYMSFEELVARRTERPNLFAQEYQCKPGYAKESYINEEKLNACVRPALVNYSIFDNMKEKDEDLRSSDVIAAIDIGKKAHPSHFTVFKRIPVRNEYGSPTGVYRHVQIHSKWMDGWDYTNARNGKTEDNFVPESPSQIEYVKLAILHFGIDRVYYDATRGEWEGFVEQGLLNPGVFIPVVLQTKMRTRIAEALDKAVASGNMDLVSDQRQVDQVLAVLKDLNAVQSSGGHGDAFWSNGMAIAGADDVQTTRGYASKPTGF